MIREASRRNLRASRGFTLVELMIVVAVVAVLAGIAVPGFRSSRERAQLRACEANQRTIAGALEALGSDRNQHLSRLDAAVMAELVEGGYLDTPPVDPGDGGTASYILRGDQVVCTRHSAAPELVPATDDRVIEWF